MGETRDGLPMAMLSHRMARAAEADFFERLAETEYHDLRMRHTAVLEMLAPGPANVTELAGHLGMTPQAMSELLDDMERGGYLQREIDPRDRRARVIRLTSRGQQAVRRCYDLLEAIEAEYAEAVGEKRYREARATFAALLASREERRADER
jgi:DNA-binding MarR family transcriptional regulator